MLIDSLADNHWHIGTLFIGTLKLFVSSPAKPFFEILHAGFADHDAATGGLGAQIDGKALVEPKINVAHGFAR